MASAKYIGAGLAAIAITGAGIGIGSILSSSIFSNDMSHPHPPHSDNLTRPDPESSEDIPLNLQSHHFTFTSKHDPSHGDYAHLTIGSEIEDITIHDGYGDFHKDTAEAVRSAMDETNTIYGMGSIGNLSGRPASVYTRKGFRPSDDTANEVWKAILTDCSTSSSVDETKQYVDRHYWEQMTSGEYKCTAGGMVDHPLDDLEGVLSLEDLRSLGHERLGRTTSDHTTTTGDTSQASKLSSHRRRDRSSPITRFHEDRFTALERAIHYLDKAVLKAKLEGVTLTSVIEDTILSNTDILPESQREGFLEEVSDFIFKKMTDFSQCEHEWKDQYLVLNTETNGLPVYLKDTKVQGVEDGYTRYSATLCHYAEDLPNYYEIRSQGIIEMREREVWWIERSGGQ